MVDLPRCGSETMNWCPEIWILVEDNYMTASDCQ